MKIGDYFGTAKGTGVLATADSKGVVDIAIYATPHVIDDETVAFIMADKLTHHNLQSNPHAAYLFMEGEDKYKGKRLFLTNLQDLGINTEKALEFLSPKTDGASENTVLISATKRWGLKKLLEVMNRVINKTTKPVFEKSA